MARRQARARHHFGVHLKSQEHVILNEVKNLVLYALSYATVELYIPVKDEILRCATLRSE